MKPIKNKDSIGYADSLKIIFKDKCVNKFLADEQALEFTFSEVLELAALNGFSGEGPIMLIAENPLSGKIYQYGNYGPYWVEHGETKGYA